MITTINWFYKIPKDYPKHLYQVDWNVTLLRAFNKAFIIESGYNMCVMGESYIIPVKYFPIIKSIRSVQNLDYCGHKIEIISKDLNYIKFGNVRIRIYKCSEEEYKKRCEQRAYNKTLKQFLEK